MFCAYTGSDATEMAGGNSPAYGKKPSERTLQEMLSSSIIVIDKPAGPTSHQVTSWVSDILGGVKTGHSGTLDPAVTGVLPVGTEYALRALDVMNYMTKEYVGILRFHSDVTVREVEEIFLKFTGSIFQMPPVRSAVKRERRTREIRSLKLLESRERRFLFRVECEAGTYIRTLCVDIGKAMCTGAQMEELRRTRAGPFREEMAVTLHQLEDAVHYWKEGDETRLRQMLIPYEALLSGLPSIVLKDSAVDSICHGADLTVKGVRRIAGTIRRGGVIALMTEKGEGVAIARALMSGDSITNAASGVASDTLRVLMRQGTYPRFRRRA
jgi:H/ACA ribonucleoprotein complex subunit 4